MKIMAVFEVISATSAIIKLLSELINKTMDMSVQGSTEDMNNEFNKQNISLELASQQARVAQELAIALRIETANEVEIEEFYDNSGNGNVGLKATKTDLTLVVNGSGRKITKRIYKFRGHNGEKSEIYEQKLNEVLTNNIPTSNSEDKKSS
jgi:hypothetical protein